MYMVKYFLRNGNVGFLGSRIYELEYVVEVNESSSIVECKSTYCELF